MSHLPQRPRTARYTFVKPREGNRTGSGLYTRRFSGGGYMQGSMTFTLQTDGNLIRIPDEGHRNEVGQHVPDFRELIAALQAADRPGDEGYFFAELELPYRDGEGEAWSDLPEAEWHYTFPISTSEVLIASTSNLPVAGSVISIRSSNPSVLDYITARVVISVEGHEITLNHPLPEEFFSLTNNLQYCYNRPHVRAFFKDDTAQWSIDQNNLARVATVNWIEDIGSTIYALKNAADLPFPPGDAGGGSARLLENGSSRLLENGSKRLLES